MTKAPGFCLRLDPDRYAKFKAALKDRGDTVTNSFQKHKSEVTGEPVSRVRTASGLNANERVTYGVRTKRERQDEHSDG